MDGDEINIAYLQARLDPQVVFIIDVPCAGMAYHVAIARLHEQRSLPECLRKRREAHRDEEILAVLHHAFGIKILGFQQRRHIYAAVFRKAEQREDVFSLLRPGIAEEDRKSTRLNSSHGSISYAVFC